MTQKWFVSQGDRVFGPWSTSDVSAHRKQGNVGDGDLIWGSGQADWVKLAQWNPESSSAAVAPRLVIAREHDDEATAIVDDAVTKVSAAPAEAWHYAVNGASHGPYTRPNLLVELRRLETFDGVALWTRGMRDWAGLFEFHDLASELGANQRRHARAPIEGRAVLKYDGLTQVASLATISEGGLGLKLDSELFAGQAITVEVQAEALGAPVSVSAEVRYCARGIVGLKFTSPAAAVRARIAGYVRQAAQAKVA